MTIALHIMCNKTTKQPVEQERKETKLNQEDLNSFKSNKNKFAVTKQP